MLNKLKLLLLTIPLLLTSCSSHNEKGYVIAKNHREPFYTTMVTFIYVNKVMVPITYLIYHAESWSLDLDENRDNKRDYTVYLKDIDLWESIEIGDYFSWETETCYDCEQTTKEKQN